MYRTALNTWSTLTGRKSYFERVFGFQETFRYSLNQRKLLDMAVFEQDFTRVFPRERCVFEVPLTASEIKNSSKDGAVSEQSDTLPVRLVDCGYFSTPSLGELRDEVRRILAEPATKQAMLEAWKRQHPDRQPRVYMEHIEGECSALHSDPQYKFATFQAASQLNLLEFPIPSSVPEDGITGYTMDPTQGPACAQACAGGAAYRNYLMRLDDDNRGQTAFRQFNGLADIEKKLTAWRPGAFQKPWLVKNGYMNAAAEWLPPVEGFLKDKVHGPRMAELIRIGVHEDIDVTNVDAPPGQKVTQTYNSAVSVAYSGLPTSVWTTVGKFILDASYEATFLVGVINAATHAVKDGTCPPVLLTQVGGGVFGNDPAWIRDAIKGAETKIARVAGPDVPLDVKLVHYMFKDPFFDE